MLSLPVGNEMFHFPTFPPHTLCVQVWVTGHDSCRVSPFGHPRIKAWLTAPRGLSQPPTSFFGSWCQGIHRAPLLTWPQRCSRPLCSSQDTDGADPVAAALAQRGGVRRGSVRACPNPTAPPRRNGVHGLEKGGHRPLPQDPTACLSRPDPIPTVPTARRRLYYVEVRRRAGLVVSVPPLSTTPARTSGRGSGPAAVRAPRARQALHRKEVIQPHLPVRLPCYDFVPIADPTFDGSLHKGWATGFGCYRLS